MKKNTKIILGVIILLLPVVVILAVMHNRYMTERLYYHIEGSFMVRLDDEVRHVSLHDLINMSPVTFESFHRRAEGVFTGVPLADVLAFTGLDYSNASSFTFFSYDGFSTGVSLADALDTESAFIVFEQDGISLAENPNVMGNANLWQQAPFRLVLLNEMFPQRWARYVFEIVIQH